MSAFKVTLLHPVAETDMPDNKYRHLGMEKEIKVLERDIKDAKRKLDEKKIGVVGVEVDENQLKKNEERLLYLEKIKELKRRKGEAERKARESKKEDGSSETSAYDMILDYEKTELKKLEEKGHKKPSKESSPVIGLELATWRFFLPVSYSNASFSEKKLSDFPHKFPHELLKEWSDLKDIHAFKDYEVRSTHPDAYLPYFALFGFRDATCWLIAHWPGSQSHEAYNAAERERACILKFSELGARRKHASTIALIAAMLGVLSLFILIHHTMWAGILGGGAFLLFVLSFAWRRELDTSFSLTEEAELLRYLKARHTASAS